ncbi:MAG: thioredoxin family protein [Acidimicrobiia bacterium]|nr:thioredoxin family protein [Acidimicrobiia bacterium]
MAETSTMLPLGTKAPDFSLPDTISGRTISLSDFEGVGALLVMFICEHCPYVKHIRQGLVDLGEDYDDEDIGIVAISSNDVDQYPDDAPEKMAEGARADGFVFPYLYDESQQVAKAYTAACTPDFFLFDADRALVYRGRFDESRPNSDTPVTGADLRAAIDAVLAGDDPGDPQYPSMGCGIKWKPGNEPS